MKGHKLHVKRKMKENNGKMKKLEASRIKRYQRISLYIFVSSVLELVPERKRKKNQGLSKDQARKGWIRQL